MNETVQSLVAYCRDNQRVCPQPLSWNALWELLPDRRQRGAGWTPPLPLILGAWHFTSDFEKRNRLVEHIEWADQHGNLSEIAAYLRKLPEEEWHHAGD
jgi:hypothetical protein